MSYEYVSITNIYPKKEEETEREKECEKRYLLEIEGVSNQKRNHNGTLLE